METDYLISALNSIYSALWHINRQQNLGIDDILQEINEGLENFNNCNKQVDRHEKIEE